MNAEAFGRQPIHFAAMAGHVQILEYLLNKGADPNAPDSRSWTPLHWAANNNSAKAVESLIKHKAEKQKKTDDGRLPMDLTSNGDILALLNISPPPLGKD